MRPCSGSTKRCGALVAWCTPVPFGTWSLPRAWRPPPGRHGGRPMEAFWHRWTMASLHGVARWREQRAVRRAACVSLPPAPRQRWSLLGLPTVGGELDCLARPQASDCQVGGMEAEGAGPGWHRGRLPASVGAPSQHCGSSMQNAQGLPRSEDCHWSPGRPVRVPGPRFLARIAQPNRLEPVHRELFANARREFGELSVRPDSASPNRRGDQGRGPPRQRIAVPHLLANQAQPIGGGRHGAQIGLGAFAREPGVVAALSGEQRQGRPWPVPSYGLPPGCSP
jgi:hypothetical protein